MVKNTGEEKKKKQVKKVVAPKENIKEKETKNLGSLYKIVISILSLLLIICLVYFIFIRDDKKSSSSEKNKNNKQSETNKKNDVEDTVKEGVLTQFVDENNNPVQTDFIINGILLVGKHHSYFDTNDEYVILNNYASAGYKKEDINSSFYLDELIDLYIDTNYEGDESAVKIVIAPHQPIHSLKNQSGSEIIDFAMERGGAIINYQKPNEWNYKYVGSGSISSEYRSGIYDIIFIYQDAPAYYINISLTKE